MYKKLFVLFIVLILVASLSFLFIYDKKEIAKSAENNSVMEKNIVEENITEDNKTEQTSDLLGTLIIEKINLEGQVIEGTSEEVLEYHIGHLEETARYDGNVGLAAHNRGNTYPYFERINELEIGDEIKYKTQYGERTYIVSNKKEILDTDWTMLENTQENKLTLITCIQNKVNQRLCVQAVEKSI